MTAEAGPVPAATPVTDLVMRARGGDQRAWDAIVERYAPLVWSICRRYRLGGADAADAGQAVWLHLVDHIGQLRDPAALPGWLATTTGRECARIVRAARRTGPPGRVLDPHDIPDQHAARAEDELLAAERHAALREALADLPPPCQHLIALLAQDPPLPYAQISARLGIPAGSIGPTRRRCLAKLRRHPAIAALADAMTHQPPPGPRPGPGGMAGPCGHRRSVMLPGGPLVVAGVSGSPGSVHALRYAADLARRHGAALVPALAWVPPGSDLLEHRYPDPELRRLWEQDAWQRLRGAIGTAFGSFPHGVRTWPLVLRGEAGPQLVSLASQPGDLLVIGAGRSTALTRLVCCPVARHCLAHARCPVLAVPPPDLAQHAGHGLRGWAFSHRGLDPGQASLPSQTP